MMTVTSLRMSCFGAAVSLCLLSSVVASALSASSSSTTTTEQNPLDPFSPDEAKQCLLLLASQSPAQPPGPYFNAATDRMSFFYEQDPPKAQVLAWLQQQQQQQQQQQSRRLSSSPPPPVHIPRKFFFIVTKTSGVWLGVVVPETNTVEGWRQVDVVKEGGPPVDLVEFFSIPKLVLADPKFIAALAKRSLLPTDVDCVPMSWGGQWNASFAAEERNGTRLLHVTCIIIDNTTNPFFRPVPFLSAVVDSDNKRILRVFDRPTEGVPNPPPNNYDDATLQKELSPLPTVHPFNVTQPEGPSYTVQGNEVTWQSWKFHVKPHPRAGIVVSLASFQDPQSKEYRSVLYQLHPSEMLVPYQNPDLDFANRDYEDVGEYGFGVLGTTMGVPSDCPARTSFFKGTIVSGNGDILTVNQALCMFERPSAVSAWRHVEAFGPAFANGRTQVELVVRMVTTVGNYDYFVDITFKQEGAINVGISATGIVEIQPTAATKVDPHNRFATEPYGTLMSPFHVATFHDHFFNFRIDLDVDGQAGRFVREKLMRVRLPPDNAAGRKSLWQVDEVLVPGELDARLGLECGPPEYWSFRHATKTSDVGNPIGYRLVPGAPPTASLMDDDDPPMKRAMFSKYPLWVTPQSDDEIWAAGNLVYQSNGQADGIAVWTGNNRTLVDQDLVLWYTIGIHHVTRQEDGPVMPTLTQSFDLVPENFFQNNPAMVIPPDATSVSVREAEAAVRAIVTRRRPTL